MVRDDFEIEPRHQDARAALTGSGLGDVAQAPPEREIRPLDGNEELRAVHPLPEDVGKGGITLEFREAEARPESADDGRHQVGQDVLGVSV
jgi:hypothetical protein